MRKLRKMLGDIDDASVDELMRLIETQSMATIRGWCVGFAESRVLPIWEKRRPGDERARTLISLCHSLSDGAIKLPQLKQYKRECGGVAHEFDGDPVLQAVARVIFDTTVQSCYAPTGSLGLLWYAAAAIAYDRMGLDADNESYDKVAAEVCADYTAALRAVAVENEPHPAKVKWVC